MNKKGLLESIADTGYNVGFGAKKNFATHDIVQKAPGLIAFSSLTVGIFALIFEPLTSKLVGATMVIMGIISLYVSNYDAQKEVYNQEGKRLTELFNKLGDLYREVDALANDEDLSPYQERLDTIRSDYYSRSISKQIMLSDWYAHYKFFWQHQIKWVNEQKKFSLFRDMIPLSFSVTFLFAVGVIFVMTAICRS